ncbi:hypothetical protein [Escherichia coli]|uniref:hypothetical protein n=1 Tax=Escherichia coli TaxID=562 RepID=UPI0037C0F462
MSTINTDLIAHIYAASESPLTNDELYREVQRKTGMSDAELHELKEFGSDNVTNGAIVIHTQRLKSDPGGNLLS